MYSDQARPSRGGGGCGGGDGNTACGCGGGGGGGNTKGGGGGDGGCGGGNTTCNCCGGCGGVGPDLDPNCLTLMFKKDYFESQVKELERRRINKITPSIVFIPE